MKESLIMNHMKKSVVGGCWDVAGHQAGTEVLTDADDITVLATTGLDARIGRHLHERHDEFGLLVQGSGRLVIGDETVEVRAGSTWAIPRGVPHGGEYDGEFRVVVWFSPGDDLAAPDRVMLD